MRAIEPTGMMSRKNIFGGNQPENRWGGHGEFVKELSLLQSARLDDRMSESAQRMSLSAMRALMRRAALGTLQFRDEPRRDEQALDEADTIRMRGCGHLIELREHLKRNQKTRFGHPRRVMRLYYFEPQFGALLSTATLCGLHIASKPAEEADFAGEQNTAIRTAASRSIVWFQEQIESNQRKEVQ